MNRKWYSLHVALRNLGKHYGYRVNVVHRDKWKDTKQPIAISFSFPNDMTGHAVVLTPNNTVIDSSVWAEIEADVYLDKIRERGYVLDDLWFTLYKEEDMADRTYNTVNFWEGTNTKQYIMLHHTATGYNTIDAITRMFTNGNQVSAHYIIDTNGDIVQIGNDDMILWHAGTGEWDEVADMNRYSIGIEIIWPLPGFTDDQKASVKKLVKHLSEKYTIPVENVIRHKDYAPGRKVDVDDSLWNKTHTSREEYRLSLVGTDMTKPELRSKIAQIQSAITVVWEFREGASEEERKNLEASNDLLRSKKKEYEDMLDR